MQNKVSMTRHLSDLFLLILTLYHQVMPDLFFYRDPEEVEREEAAKEAEVNTNL